MQILAIIIALVVCVTIHEASHALAANLLGDPTPKRDGRLSLNPMRHLDPLGVLAIFLFKIGWGKPVMINDRNFRSPVRDSALTAVAGPLSNLLTAFLIALPLKYWDSIDDFPNILLVLQSIFALSIGLAIFNLIPLPPFDGSKVLGLFIPAKYQYSYDKFMERGVAYVLIGFLFDIYVLNSILGYSLVHKMIAFFYDLVASFIFLNT